MYRYISVFLLLIYICHIRVMLGRKTNVSVCLANEKKERWSYDVFATDVNTLNAMTETTIY